MTDRPIERRSARRARYDANAFEVLIACLCALVALAYFLQPHYLEQSPMGQAEPFVRYAWVSGLSLSCIGILVGLWTGRANLEVAGLILLSSAAGMQAVALVFIIGMQALVSIGTFVAVTWAALTRARLVWKHGMNRVIVADLESSGEADGQ